MSQFQCGRSASQLGYPSLAWWAVTPPTTYWDANPSQSDKSLTPSSCGVVVSCGISNSFPLLSPSLSQVIHALLTRSPLS